MFNLDINLPVVYSVHQGWVKENRRITVCSSFKNDFTRSDNPTLLLSILRMDFKDFKKVIEVKGPEVAVNSLLFYGPVFYFQNDQKKYFFFKHKLSEKLDIHTNDIEIVGSARLGFSLNREKFGKPFGKESDIDVAIVSNRLFERAWLDLISIKGERLFELLPKEKANLTQCQSDIYWGYVSPERIPSRVGFSKWWWPIFEEMSLSEKRKVRARLFMSWKRAEMHYSYTIQKVLKSLS